MRMPFLEKEIQILYPKKGTQIACKALWDTGANASMITRHVVEALGLEVLSYTDVTGIHGTERRPVYSITLVLADSVIFERTKVIGANSLPDEHEAILGMDVITLLDFAITNFGGNTTHSIRYPSLREIDFENDDE